MFDKGRHRGCPLAATSTGRPRLRAASAGRGALALLVLALLLAAAACGGGGGDERQRGRGGPPGARGAGWGGPGGSPAAEPTIPVVIEQSSRGTMEAFLESTSTLEAEEDVAVVAQATGVVVEILHEEGDQVRAGALLARLEYREIELAEARARSEYERLQADFERVERLRREQLISEDDYSQVKFDLARARIDWQQAQLELERTRLVAPISGTVTERLVRLGQLVRENDAVYRLVDFDSIKAPVFVPEKYIGQLGVGQPAIITAPALDNRRIRGRVERISPVVDSQSGTVRVLVDPTARPELRPGMFANVQLVLDAHEDTVIVPKRALVYDDERPRLFVVDESGHAERRELELGYEDEERAEVLEGVEAGEWVVVVGQSALKDESRVAAQDLEGNILFEAADPEPAPAAQELAAAEGDEAAGAARGRPGREAAAEDERRSSAAESADASGAATAESPAPASGAREGGGGRP